jgi:hypothetical protein
MRIEVSHRLDLADSIGRMCLAGTFLGMTFQATLSVEQRRVVVDGPDPGILLRRQAIAYVTRKLDEYLRPESSQTLYRSKSSATERTPVASVSSPSRSAIRVGAFAECKATVELRE